MSQEDMQRLAHNAKMIEIEDKGWLEKIKVALERGEDASEVFKRYLDETENQRKHTRINPFNMKLNIQVLKLKA